jgi:hypothetical protein
MKMTNEARYCAFKLKLNHKKKKNGIRNLKNIVADISGMLASLMSTLQTNL